MTSRRNLNLLIDEIRQHSLRADHERVIDLIRLKLNTAERRHLMAALLRDLALIIALFLFITSCV